MSTFQGIGTQHLGISAKQPDGSYQATRFFVVLFLPVFPVSHDTFIPQAMRTDHRVNTTTVTTEYLLMHREPVRWGEALRVYLMWWLLLPAVLLGMPTLLIWAAVTHIVPPGPWALTLLGVALVWYLTAFVIVVRRHHRRIGTAALYAAGRTTG